jgi:hypothetical protein
MRDDIEIAKLAALTAGELEKVDQSLIQRSSAGPARKINPNDFISKPIPSQLKPKHQIIKDSQFIQAPRTHSPSREVIGKEQVDIRNLMIPIPDDLKQRIKSVEQGHTQLPQSPVPVVGNITPLSNPIVNHTLTSNDQKLDNIEKKINKIIRILQKNAISKQPPKPRKKSIKR